MRYSIRVKKQEHTRTRIGHSTVHLRATGSKRTDDTYQTKHTDLRKWISAPPGTKKTIKTNSQKRHLGLLRQYTTTTTKRDTLKKTTAKRNTTIRSVKAKYQKNKQSG